MVGALASAGAAPAAAPNPAGRFYMLRDRVALSGPDVGGAYSSVDPLGNPDIVLEFTAKGELTFQHMTAEIARRGSLLSSRGFVLNQHLAVVLDGKLLTVLYVDYRVYPHGIPAANGADITGGFTSTSAQQLAAEISAPPLPADLELIDSTRFTRGS